MKCAHRQRRELPELARRWIQGTTKHCSVIRTRAEQDPQRVQEHGHEHSARKKYDTTERQASSEQVRLEELKYREIWSSQAKMMFLFSILTLCRLVIRFQRYGEIYCLHLQVEYGDGMFVRTELEWLSQYSVWIQTDLRQGQRILPPLSVLRPALRPTQPPI
jgi:hypothetical protein